MQFITFSSLQSSFTFPFSSSQLFSLCLSSAKSWPWRCIGCAAGIKNRAPSGGILPGALMTSHIQSVLLPSAVTTLRYFGWLVRLRSKTVGLAKSIRKGARCISQCFYVQMLMTYFQGHNDKWLVANHGCVGIIWGSTNFISWDSKLWFTRIWDIFICIILGS